MSQDEVKQIMKDIAPFFGTDNKMDFSEFHDLWFKDKDFKKSFKSQDKMTERLLNIANSIKRRRTVHRVRKLVKTAKKNARFAHSSTNKATKRIKGIARK